MTTNAKWWIAAFIAASLVCLSAIFALALEVAYTKGYTAGEQLEPWCIHSLEENVDHP